jgi:3-hydroxyacyl-CoA dehydrogenase
MERQANPSAPEAPTDERASSSPSGDTLAFEPAALRYRSDGWTPERQREFIEALAETGVIRDAAAKVAMTEQSVSRLRRRPEARAFDIACDAAQRIGARRLVSVAVQRAVEGNVRRRYWRGEVVGEERVYDNKLLMFLIGKLGETLAPRSETADVEARWESWMEAIEAGAPPPPPAGAARAAPPPPPLAEDEDEDEDEFSGTEVMQCNGKWWTSFPPPRNFEGEERKDSLGCYQRSLTPAEFAWVQAQMDWQRRQHEERRDRFFGFDGEEHSSWEEAEPSEPSAPLPAQVPPPEPPPETPKVDVHVNAGQAESPYSAETEMSPISTTRHGDILIVTSNNPPVNALGIAVREGLVAAMEEADGDESVKAVVIICQGSTFFAGADITEFGKPMQLPMLPQVVDRIEACTKPVVAAIHGTAFGGGLEVALASHYRVALPSAKLGVPEVKLGLLPGAGGTQRLPRVAGVGKALEMAATGNPIGAREAYEVGLIDRLIEGDLLQHAVAYADEVKDTRPIRKSSELDDKLAEARDNPGIFDEFRKANARKFRGFDAPEYNVRAIEAAVSTPYSEGVMTERQLFMELMTGTQARAQQYFFFAERKAAKIENLPEDTKPRDIRKVGVIGAGTMGGGISMNFLNAGIPVRIIEQQQDALDRGTGVIRKNYEATAAKGKMTAEQVEGAMGLLTPSLSLDDLSDCDLIIEAVFENMDVKKDVFGKLDQICKPGAILATNTSYLNVDEIAASTSRPEDVVGLHFFSPANIMKLLEVVRGAKTAPDVLVTAMQLAKKIRKVAVVAGVCYGFIGNRMLIPRQTQAMRLLLEGATPEQVDRVYTDFGMPMGPFQMADLAGVDIGWHRDPTRIENIRDALCAIDRWGQKKGAGFYDYDEKRRPSPSPKVQEIIEQFRAQEGIEAREISDQEIVERTLYTMVNEGALILEGGYAQRASDIDVVWIYGYGWPVYRGGPMHWADTEGLPKIVEGIRRQQERLGADFELSDLLVQKAEAGEKFTR